MIGCVLYMCCCLLCGSNHPSNSDVWHPVVLGRLESVHILARLLVCLSTTRFLGGFDSIVARSDICHNGDCQYLLRLYDVLATLVLIYHDALYHSSHCLPSWRFWKNSCHSISSHQ